MRHHSLLAALLLLPSCSDARREEVARSTARIVTSLPAMNFGRADGACSVAGTGELVVTGAEISGGPLSTAEVFDPVKHVWTEIALLASPRGRHASVTLATGAVMVHGGYGTIPDAINAPGSSAEVFDPVKRTWSSRASGSTPRAGHALVRLLDGRVLAIGGYTSYESLPTSTAEIYDPSADTWTAAPSMATRRNDPAAVLLADGRVFVAGNQASGVAEVFEAKSGWTPTSPMKTPRQRPAAALLHDGRVIVLGGTDGSVKDLSTTEIWDPKTNAFTDGPTMLATHGQSVGAVALPSGAIVVAGADDTKIVERLDQAATTWTKVGTLTENRIGACISGIPGGGVVFAGNGLNSPASYTVDGYFGAAFGTGCASGDECASGTCTSGKCTAPPALDAGVDASPPPIDAATSTPVLTGTFQRCSKASDCATGHCVDGVCCDTACTETCHSCVLPNSAGICTIEPIGVDLRGECGIALTCTGTCSGDGKCIGATVGSQCTPAHCTSASTGVGPALCTARGARCPSDVTPFDCAPYACEPIFGACRTRCTASSDCAGGSVCDVQAGTCAAPAPSDSGGGGCTYARRSSFASTLAMSLALVAIFSRRRR